jgi:molybdopterin/thiamine biosynthesis adenylyltransferase
VSGPWREDADQWRERLVLAGFSDDGEHLRGPVPWRHPERGDVTAQARITLGEAFPFAPPRVVIPDPGTPVEFTFHIELDGALCLWENDWAVDQAPWREPRELLGRIAGWLEKTAAGWPGDDVCDLERYLGQDPDTLVLYDAAGLSPGHAVRTMPGPTAAATLVTCEQRRLSDHLPARGGRRGKPGRKDKQLAWVADIGAVEHPLRIWSDVAAVLGSSAGEVSRAISFGIVNLLLLRYSRGANSSVLALKARRTVGGIEVTACESADMSLATRTIRAGRDAQHLTETKLAVVGCGAVGSFAADLLFRSGVRKLTLRDGEKLRPGNVVRHLAGTGQVGLAKADAVRECLARIDSDVSGVKTQPRRLDRFDDALALVRDHDVVLDATGNARASSLLATAAQLAGPGLGHSVVSACIQRDGEVLRADRMPPRGAERYLPALPLLDDSAHAREQGCGSPISPAPPGAVIAAAELACRVVIDEATRQCSMPATVAEVRWAQPEPPFDHVGRVTSDENPTAQ